MHSAITLASICLLSFLAGCNKNSSEYSVDKTCKIVINPQFFAVEEFKEGFAAIKIGDSLSTKQGFVDLKGKMLIAPRFDKVHEFSEGFAAVKIGDETDG